MRCQTPGGAVVSGGELGATERCRSRKLASARYPDVGCAAIEDQAHRGNVTSLSRSLNRDVVFPGDQFDRLATLTHQIDPINTHLDFLGRYLSLHGVDLDS